MWWLASSISTTPNGTANNGDAGNNNGVAIEHGFRLRMSLSDIIAQTVAVVKKYLYFYKGDQQKTTNFAPAWRLQSLRQGHENLLI